MPSSVPEFVFVVSIFSLRAYCNFTNFRCVKISVTSDHGAFGKV